MIEIVERLIAHQGFCLPETFQRFQRFDQRLACPGQRQMHDPAIDAIDRLVEITLAFE